VEFTGASSSIAEEAGACILTGAHNLLSIYCTFAGQIFRGEIVA